MTKWEICVVALLGLNFLWMALVYSVVKQTQSFINEFLHNLMIHVIEGADDEQED